ncbi:MAG: MarR family transcriptional regulator [Armatimonadetes bacterium]|nr:MarR family transcriptional regulator [Armatimonadota bacterium]
MSKREMPEAPDPPPASLPPSLSVWTGYLFSRVAQRCQERFDTLMEPCGVRARHFRVLAVLGEGESLSQAEIGERLGIDRNTMVLLLDDLEGRGLIMRRRAPEDRRAHRVGLTDAGREILARGMEMARRTSEEVFAPLSPDERAQLHALIRRLF